MSGIATLTAAFVQKVDGLPVRIIDTRKTTPGLRAMEMREVPGSALTAATEATQSKQISSPGNGESMLRPRATNFSAEYNLLSHLPKKRQNF